MYLRSAYRLLLAPAAFCLLLLMLSGLATAQTPSFSNGNFESGSKTGWSVWNPQSRPFSFGVTSDPAKVHGGRYAGIVNMFDGPQNALVVYNAASTAGLPAGTLLRVAYYIKTDNLVFNLPGRGVQTVLLSRDTYGNVLTYSTASGIFSGNNDYTLVEYLLELPQGAIGVDCQINIGGGISQGSLLIDDLTIEVLSEAGPATPEVFLDCRVRPDASGTPRLSINGQNEAPTMFFGNNAGNTGGGVVYDEISKAATAGVRLIQFGFDLPWWGFSTGQIAAALRRNPDALFLLRISMEPPASWIKSHPMPVVYNDVGDAKTNYTLASDELTKAWQHQLELVIRFLARSPFRDRIVAIHPTYLSGGEWFYPDLHLQYYDYSEANRARFAAWSAAKYNNSLSALNAAWKTSLSDFSAIQVPPTSEWNSGDDGFFRSPATRRWVTDYQLYHNDLVSDRILELGAQVKATSGGRMLFACFQGYQFELLGNGSQHGVGHTGHMALRRLLDSPNVDIIASPVSYFDRQVGGSSNVMGPVDTIALAGKLQLQEDDSRTWLWKNAEPSLYYPTEWDTLQCLRRNFGNVLSHNVAIWWMDLVANGNFDADSIWQSNQKLREAYEDSIKHAQPSRPQVALIYDEDTPFWIRGDSLDLSYTNGIAQRIIFQSLGAQVGYYNIDDLGRLPASVRLIVFVNTFRMDASERQLVQNAKSGGRTLLWLFAPGYLTEDAFSAATMADLTGFTLTRMSGFRQATIKVNGNFAPLTEGLTDHVFGPSAAMKPVFTVGTADSGVRVLGTYTLDNTPALALREFAGWNSIFCGSPTLSLPLLRAIARYSGVTLQVDADQLDTTDVIQTNGRYMFVYARDAAGRRSFQLPGEKVPNGGFERFTGALPTSGFGGWTSPLTGSLSASVAAGAGFGGTQGLKLGPFAAAENQYSVPLGIKLALQEGKTYDISCRVYLNNVNASAALPGNYIYLQFSPDQYVPGQTVTFPLAEGNTVSRVQGQWLRFRGRYTHRASSADQPQMAIRLAMYGAYQGEAIVLDDVSVREAGSRPAKVTDLMTGRVIAGETTNWVDDFQVNEQKIYQVEDLVYSSSSRFWQLYGEN